MGSEVENIESLRINLDEIAKISESEFTKYFHQWLEEDNTARSLQAKLRKDLIEIFNKTKLGCKISTQYTNLHRIMLSPLILVLNTIVAEFLYSQNYHYSLSIFCTEIPYRHTLPNFEKTRNFRFNETELNEIFEAISPSMKIPTELQRLIIDDYLEIKDSNKTEVSSLLYCIFNNVFVKLQKKISDNTKVFQINEQKNCNVNFKTNSKKQYSTSNHQIMNYTYYLHKYLLLLSKKIKDMSQTLKNLENRNDLNNLQQHHKQKSSMKIVKNYNKFELLNRSLSNLSTNLRYLLMSKRKNRKISEIVQVLEKMTKQFEQCTRNIELIVKKLNDTASITNQNENKTKHEKKYYEWIDEMKTTKNGKKFLAKIEACLLKTLENEKIKLFEEFKIEIEKQRQLIEMKYKEKSLQDLQDEEAERLREENIEKTIEEKIRSFGLTDIPNLKRKDEIQLQKQNQQIQTDLLFDNVLEKQNNMSSLQDLNKNCAVKENEKVNDIISLQKEILKKLSDQQTFSEQSKQPSTELESDVRKTNNTVTAAAKCSERSIKSLDNFKPRIQEITKTILQKERNMDQIIFEAKLRIQELENENNQLNKLFQDYLDKQKLNKSNIEKNVTGIWDDYKFGKAMLHKKCDAIKATKSLEKFQKENELLKLTNDNTEPFSEAKAIKSSDSLQIDTGIKSLERNIIKKEPVKVPVFQNPFRELQKHFQCRKNCIMDLNLNELESSNTNDEKLTDSIEATGDISTTKKVESSRKRDELFSLKTFTIRERSNNCQTVQHSEDRSSVNDNRFNNLKVTLSEIESLPHLKMNTIPIANNQLSSNRSQSSLSVSPIKLLSNKSSSVSTSTETSEVKRKLFDISKSEKNIQNDE